MIKKETRYLSDYIENIGKYHDNKIKYYIEFKNKIGKLFLEYYNLLSELIINTT